MIRRRTDKLTERSVEPYKVKDIISLNATELELPSSVRIHPVVMPELKIPSKWQYKKTYDRIPTKWDTL